MLLEQFGYERKADIYGHLSNDWKSPFSASFSTRAYDDHWVSFSYTDAEKGIGRAKGTTGADGDQKQSKYKYRYGSAFDLIAFYQFGNDVDAARSAIEEMARAERAQTIAKIGAYQVEVAAALGEEIPPPTVYAGDDAFDLSHDALASDMGRRGFGQAARYVPLWGRWMFWNDQRWTVDENLMHMTRTREFLRLRADELAEWAEGVAKDADPVEAKRVLSMAEREGRMIRSATVVAAIEKLARSNPGTSLAPDVFDADLMLLGTPGGTVDLVTGVTREPDRADYISKTTAVAPVAGSPRRWLAFLTEIMAGDLEKVAFLQRLAGYALTGSTTEHKLFFLYGTGRNGKGVFMNTLMQIWQDYARKAAAQTFLSSQGEKHPTDVAGLRGARLVFGSELPVGKSWDESVIKDLTGGDRMTARFMRQDFFDFDPQMTLIIAGNNQPSIRGVDEAMRSRLVLVPFTVTIPAERRDPNLQRVLFEEEGGQILQWAIDGAVAWVRDGLQIPDSVRAASDVYLDSEDIIGQFVADKAIIDVNGFVMTSVAYKEFKHWCEDRGLRAWSFTAFRKEMAGRFETARTRNGNGFNGLRLKRQVV